MLAQKWYFRSERKKIQHYHQIQRIRIIFCTKLHLKKIDLIFLTIFTQKRYFLFKSVQINITIGFPILELV